MPLEQQARYIAYSWGGILPAPTDAQLRAALQACQDEGHHSDYENQNAVALRFARLCGTDPDPASLGDPALLAKIRRSATTGILYRLTGPDALPDGIERFLRQYEKYAPPEGH